MFYLVIEGRPFLATDLLSVLCYRPFPNTAGVLPGDRSILGSLLSLTSAPQAALENSNRVVECQELGSNLNEHILAMCSKSLSVVNNNRSRVTHTEAIR